MKCGYGELCRYGGQVDKDSATKIGSRYWHKKCAKEKELKNRIFEEYYAKFQSKQSSQAVRTAIKRFVNELDYEAEYVLYCLLYKTKELSNIYWLQNTLIDERNIKDYKKLKARATKIEFNQPINDNFDDEVVKINTKKDRKWGDILDG